MELVTKYLDIFRNDHCGYWLRAIAHDDGGWLVWEDDEEHLLGQEPNADVAKSSWERRVPLPLGWYYLDTVAASKAYDIGVLQWGENWYEEGDSDDFDVVIQLALLGEVRYN